MSCDVHKYSVLCQFMFNWTHFQIVSFLIYSFFCLPVHPTDTMRIDIVIPFEQHFYLKAPSPHERHAWLVALGSAKAGIPPAIPQAKVEKGKTGERISYSVDSSW